MPARELLAGRRTDFQPSRRRAVACPRRTGSNCRRRVFYGIVQVTSLPGQSARPLRVGAVGPVHDHFPGTTPVAQRELQRSARYALPGCMVHRISRPASVHNCLINFAVSPPRLRPTAPVRASPEAILGGQSGMLDRPCTERWRWADLDLVSLVQLNAGHSSPAVEDPVAIPASEANIGLTDYCHFPKHMTVQRRRQEYCPCASLQTLAIQRSTEGEPLFLPYGLTSK